MSNNQQKQPVILNTTTKDAFDIFNSILNDDCDISHTTHTGISTNNMNSDNNNENNNDNNNNNNNDNNNDNDTCYISGQRLDKSKTTLPCGHSFNYIPLLNDLINYKKTHGINSLYYTHSNKYFSCPYCRKFVKGTLPYRPDISPIRYNNINKPITSSFVQQVCIHNKNCGKNDHCDNNATIPIDDNNYVCYRHYKKVFKNINAKTNTKTKYSQLSNTKHSQCADINKPGCSSILKTGKRKGETCNAKTLVENTPFCKRHQPA